MNRLKKLKESLKSKTDDQTGSMNFNIFAWINIIYEAKVSQANKISHKIDELLKLEPNLEILVFICPNSSLL